MDEQSIKVAAKRARELARLEEDKTFQPIAFGVLFNRLLETQGGIASPGAFRGRSESPTIARGVRSGKHLTKVGPLQRIRDLAGDGFFKAPRGLKETLEELQLRGHNYDQAVVGKSLLRLVHERALRRTRRKEVGREFYAYTEW